MFVTLAGNGRHADRRQHRKRDERAAAGDGVDQARCDRRQRDKEVVKTGQHRLARPARIDDLRSAIADWLNNPRSILNRRSQILNAREAHP